VEDVAPEAGVSKPTIYVWKAKYSVVDKHQVEEAIRLREENTHLKKLVLDLTLGPRNAQVSTRAKRTQFVNASTTGLCF